MKYLSGAYAQVSDHLLTPSLDLHQEQKLSTDYPLQFVRIDNHRCQERSFEIPPQHLPRHSQAAIIVSRANFSSVVEPQTMSSGEVRRVSRQDIQLVQNLIERCLQLYMNQREVVETLLVQAKIEPGFTELVWQKLEEENREFFKAYHLRLMVKNQIMIFNKLLKQQVELMRKICPPGVTSLPVLNGSSHSSSLHQAPSCYVSEPTAAPSRPEIHNSLGCSPSVLMSNGLQVHQNMQTPNNASTHAGRMDISTNMHSNQFSHMGTMHEIKHMDMIHGMNEIAVKAEPSFSNSSFTFGADRNVSETRPTIRDTCVSTFSNTDSNSQTLSVPPLLDADTSSFGFLGQIPRNFSLSDLTADFSQSSDILESYSRSPFLVADDFLDSPGRECHGYDKQLDTISEGKSYDDFGSD